MFKFNNTHIFTGYLKQKLSSVNIPTCKIYTKEFADYLAIHKKEDPRIIKSIDTIFYNEDDKRLATRINYLKNNELYNYFWKYDELSSDLGSSSASWKRSSAVYYDSEKTIPGLTKTLHSPGRFYDTITHEYLGDYLRFLRDYHNINLMSLYNCFNNNICNNIYLPINIDGIDILFNSHDSKYNIYAIPVKLFANYTIAIDSYQGIELFCGLYNTTLDTSDKSLDLIKKTYKKIRKSIFRQPFLYDMLNVKNWTPEAELQEITVNDLSILRINNNIISRWDIANREQDLKLFIKVPTSCKSSITILEGDFRNFNDVKYTPVTDNTTLSQTAWSYKQNHTVVNFNTAGSYGAANLNDTDFTPISKLQLLEFNTGESYPFADRLVEYLSDSAVTPIDQIPDNIKRVQRVMKQNQHYFKIEGLWENKIQKIIYDYIVNSGPVEDKDGKLVDKHYGYHPKLGHTTKSTLYDVLGYVDKNAEKWYASWKDQNGKIIMRDSIQNVDIYEGLYDI